MFLNICTVLKLVSDVDGGKIPSINSGIKFPTLGVKTNEKQTSKPDTDSNILHVGRIIVSQLIPNYVERWISLHWVSVVVFFVSQPVAILVLETITLRNN